MSEWTDGQGRTIDPVIEVTTCVWKKDGEWYYDTKGLPVVTDGTADAVSVLSVALKEAGAEHQRRVIEALQRKHGTSEHPPS